MLGVTLSLSKGYGPPGAAVQPPNVNCEIGVVAEEGIMSSRRFLTGVIVAISALLCAAYVLNISGGAATVAAQQRGEVAGLARLSGSVTAPQAFKAAQVYIRNMDKNVTYMVFTNAGAVPVRGALSRQLRSEGQGEGARVGRAEDRAAGR